MESFEKIVRNFYPLSDKNLTLLLPHIRNVSYPKDICFIKQGSVKKEMYFIAEGLVKANFIFQDKEYTLTFYKETDCFFGGLYFWEEIPFTFNMITLQKSTFYTIDKQSFENLIDINVEFVHLAIKLIDKERLDVIKGMILHKCYSPTDQYKFVLNQMENIPINQIATFLGITVPSLSRIRKKIKK